jgi:hypothetical protein
VKGLKPTLVSAIAIGLLAGSVVGVVAQDEAAEGAEPTDPIESEPTMEPMVPPDTGGAVLADARVIDLVDTSGLQFTQNVPSSE